MKHEISAEWLTIDKVGEILREHAELSLSADARNRIETCRNYLDNKMETQKEPIYGITTGFGSLCNISIDATQLRQLQKNLVMSHSCGVGERVPDDIVRLMLLLKAQSLSYGNSGVQLVTVQRLLDFFNNDILPVVYQQGSLGASGDLAPLANMDSDSLDLDRLISRLEEGEVHELILALGATIDAENTASFIRNLVRKRFPHIRVSRLAQGIPLGAEVKYMDRETLRQSLQYRQDI